MKLVWRLIVILEIVVRFGGSVEDEETSLKTTTTEFEESTSTLNEISTVAHESTTDLQETSTDAQEITTTSDVIGEITTQTVDEDTTVQDQDEDTEAVEEGSGLTTDEDEKKIVVSNADYSFSSSDSEITIKFELLADGTVWLVCGFKADNETITFQGDKGAPEIWLIKDRQSCSGLTGIVLGQLLGTINKSGNESAATTLTWDQLPGNCLLILQKSLEESTTTTETSTDTVTATDTATETTITSESDTDTETSTETDTDTDTTTETLESSTVDNSRSIIEKYKSVLTLYPSTRGFSSLDLSSFSIFASGSTGAFTIPSVTIYKPAVFSGYPLVTVPYNKWNTLPLLQLPGWSSSTVYYIAWAMFSLYYAFAAFSAGPAVNLQAITRRISGVLEDNRGLFSSRVDDLQYGLADIVYQAINNFNPYENSHHYYDYYNEPVQMY